MKFFLSTFDISATIYLKELVKQIEGEFIWLDKTFLSTVGATEAVGKIIPAMRALAEALKKIRWTDCLILADSPEFNMILGRFARALKPSLKIIYFIPPQVWAWRPSRAKVLARIANRVLTILPFEEEIFKSVGCDAYFVGHPLLEFLPLDVSKDEAKRQLGLEGKVLAVLPGSRPTEVRRILPQMLKVCSLLHGFNFVIPLSCQADVPHYFKVVGKEMSWRAIASADVCLIASGTASLEAGLMLKPSVVVYKVSTPTYIVGKLLVRIGRISLVNIVLKEDVFPEFIQNIPHYKIAQMIPTLVDESKQISEKLLMLRDCLSGGGLKYAAKLITDVVKS